MKTTGVKKIITLVLCYGFIFGLGEATLVAAEGTVESSSENPIEFGRLFYIGRETVTIGDQGYAITTTTHYRTKGGGVTTKGHFRVGDEVQFLFDPTSMTIIELRIKKQGSESEFRREKGKRGGGVQFKDGVWTN